MDLSSGSRQSIAGIDDMMFEKPVLLEGGEYFMRGPAQQGPDQALWASNPSVITKLLGPAIDADVPVYGLPVTMARTGKDYSTMPTDVLVEMLNFSDIDPAAAKKFNENMAKQGYIGFDAVDDFPGVDAPVPVLREYFDR